MAQEMLEGKLTQRQQFQDIPFKFLHSSAEHGTAAEVQDYMLREKLKHQLEMLVRPVPLTSVTLQHCKLKMQGLLLSDLPHDPVNPVSLPLRLCGPMHYEAH